MAAYESRIQRLEERVRVPGTTQSWAEQVKLQELIVGACYGVRQAAFEIVQKAEAGAITPGGDRKFPDRFMQSAEVDLIHQQRYLRQLTGDDDATWNARLARIEAESHVSKARTRAKNG
jgi:hypothetical protein